jgi:hypothetical protein
MKEDSGALTRRRLLSAGAVAGAAVLAGSPGVAGATAVSAPARPDGTLVASAGPTESRLYAGITLTAGNELDVPTSTVFSPDPRNGAYPSTVNGYVGASLDVPVGSLVNDVVFFLYQEGNAQQTCALQMYHPTTGGVEVLLSHVVSGDGSITVSAAGVGAGLPRRLGADDALAAFVWRGEASAVCRGIRVDYVPVGGGGGVGGGQTGGALIPIPPARVYDSRGGGGKLRDGDVRTVSVAAALDGTPVVPPGATAAMVTVTVTDTEGSGGYVAVYPGGGSWSGTSSVNWFGPGQNLATAAFVALGGNRDLSLRAGVNATNVLIDVTGYAV